MSNAIVFPDTESAMQACGVGSVFERVAHGWKVRFVDGGTQVFVEGASIADALASHGTQVFHPVPEIPQGIVEVDEERRAPLDEQPIALAVAEEAGVLPDVDRRTGKKKKADAE